MMDQISLNKKDILQMIFSGKITSGEGFQLLKENKYTHLSDEYDEKSNDKYSDLRNDSLSSVGRSTEIAIIGMSGRFPDAGNVDEFWNNLASGKDSVKEIPPNRWRLSEFYDPDPEVRNKSYSKWAGLISDIDKFDSHFFNIIPREAELMDPQQRLFLEEAFRALEDAGYSDKDLGGKPCCVFVGCGGGDYQMKLKDEKVLPEAYSFMGNSASILASRISYFLNLKGPSVSIDTSCSSSLVAIHLACESILNGTSELGIAGGVFISTTPAFHILASNCMMLSPEGKCKAFDQSADGFVPGEGVGVVVLKSLSLALRDRDHIYGVIKGSGINQDGKTNGITAPSALSQTALENEVYQKYRISPERISYVEAHGTGTKLGDPIEVDALTTAFRKYTNKKQYCVIGSVKTNIGHALTASGVASLIKVLLSLKNQKIPPSLHFNKSNEHIVFTESPFYVTSELRDWQKEGDLPRQAAISSFGFSGTNCHMIIEEAPLSREGKTDKNKPYYLVVLSAKTDSALRQKCEDLADWLSKEGTVNTLRDIAYTHHLGRSHYGVRSAFVVSDKQTLLKSLRMVCEKGQAVNCFSTSPETDNKKSDKLLRDRSKQLLDELESSKLEDEVYKDRLLALAELYVKGYDLNWVQLYGGEESYRISLPTYPFERERYWVPDLGKNKDEISRSIDAFAGRLHPFIDCNTSNLREQRFTTRLKGDAFYLADHVVESQVILPGVVYLEMARAAGEIAGEGKVQKIKNMVWAKPIVVGERSQDVSISLYPYENDVEFEVSISEENNQRVVHAQGKLVYENHATVQTKNEIVNIEAIKDRCSSRKTHVDCYKFFKTYGFNYGKTFQVIQELYCSKTEALARLELPLKIMDEFEDFVFHPSLMDGALQAVMGLLGDRAKESGRIYVPFALNEIEIVRSLSKKCYSHVTLARSQPSQSSSIKKFNITLTDQTGRVLIRMSGFSVKILRQEPVSMKVTDKLWFYPVWERSEIMPNKKFKISGPVLIFDHGEELCKALKERLLAEEGISSKVILVKPGNSYQELGTDMYEVCPGQLSDYQLLVERLKIQGTVPGKILHLWADERFVDKEESLKGKLDRCVYSVFCLTQVLMFQKLSEKIKLLYIYPLGQDGPEPLYRAISGLNRTIRLENPNFLYKTIEIPSRGTLTETCLLDTLLPEFQGEDNDDVEVRYEEHIRLVKRFKEYKILDKLKDKVSLRENGVYFLTGGVGRLGLILAEYLARQFKAKLVLTGRSDLSAEQELKIKALKSLGSEVMYMKGDVSCRNDVDEWMNQTKERFEIIHGIIHCAGVTRDSFVLKKTREEMEAVLAPKVFGSINLDETTRDMQLDFFVLFSSLAGVLGNVGQGDYAYANSYLDWFAEKREALRIKGKRYGKTLSINWPLWKDGGIRVDKMTEEWMVKKKGIAVMSKDAGWNAFVNGLSFPHSQLMVFEGDRQKISRLFSYQEKEESIEPVDIDQEILQGDGKDLEASTQTYLKEILSKEIKMPVSKIKVQEPLEKFGIDSIMIMKITRELERDFGELSKTLFFEYQSLAELALYFIENHRVKLVSILGSHSDLSSGKAGHRQIEKVEKNELKRLHPGRFLKNNEFSGEAQALQADAIAIVGLSGQYPMAHGIKEFWENLKVGKDCIIEIPKERWDFHQFYNSEKGEKGNRFSKWGGFIFDVDKFDPLFFNISPREAEIMDPQERLFLETVWHTIEDAGYTREALDESRVGVFVGVMWGQYQLFGAKTFYEEHSFAPSSSYGSIANRVSYYFNFHGPSIALDTMCSSSLTAIHLACESIHRGESEMAIAGGVNVSIHPNKYVQLGQGQFTSSDGRCRSFGEGGDGYVPGEGVGAILLKRLSKAIEDGDHIYAVVKGSTVNHGGKTNGYTVPNPKAQGALIKDALKKAKVDAETISYIEAHGTGTSLGDPIEIAGLMRAYEGNNEKQYCSIGSVKSNIGHLESAAGIAGVTKVLLQMMHKQLVPSIHSDKLNPNIDFKDSPFYVQHELTDWKQPVIQENGEACRYPRRAGISSFGAGGSNAHIILEEFDVPIRYEATTKEESQIIVLSAKNKNRLKAYAGDMVNFLENVQTHEGENCSNPSLSDIAYTLQVGREGLEERLAIVVSSRKELLERLKSYCQGESDIKGLYTGNVKTSHDKIELLVEGEVGDTLVKTIIRKKDFSKLAALWISGIHIDWVLLHTSFLPNRISLPTYPFEKARYWFDNYHHKNVKITREGETLSEHKSSDNIKLSHSADERVPDSLFKGETMSNKGQGDEVLLQKVDENIAIVVMQDRENKNMFSKDIILGLMDKFSDIQKDKNIKAVIITGYDNIFCMGGTQEILLNIAERKNNFTDIPFLYRGLLECEIPVIAAIQGHASGGGLLFGLYADIIVMSEEGIYSSNFTQYGFTPGMGATFILKDKLGNNLATEMMFTAKSFQGKELQQRGASFIFRKRTEVLKEALAIARSLSKKPIHTLKVLKKNLAGKLLEQLPAVIEDEVNMHEQTMRNPEVKERIQHYFNPSTSSAIQTLNNDSNLVEKNIQSKIVLKTAQEQSHKLVKNPENRIVRLKNKLNGAASVGTISDTKPDFLRQSEVKPIGVTVQNNRVQDMAATDIAQWGNKSKEHFQSKIGNIVSDILHLTDKIDQDISLKDLGVDSIGAVEIVRDINQLFGLNLEAITLYEYSTISKLAQYVYDESKKINQNSQDLGSVNYPTNKDYSALYILRRLEKGELKIDEAKKLMEVL